MWFGWIQSLRKQCTFYKIHAKLTVKTCVTQHLLWRGAWVIVPAVLQQTVLDVYHLGVTKELLSYAWWSGLHSDIEHQKTCSVHPMHRTTTSGAFETSSHRPWQRTAVDITDLSTAQHGYTL